MEAKKSQGVNSRRVSLRRATDADWQIFVGQPPPPLWFGFVAENSYMRIGLGGIYSHDNKAWWATFAKAPGVRGYPVLMAKAARETFAVADGLGLEVHAMCDETIAGASKWLVRLGFVETENAIGGRQIWVRK